MIIVSSNSPWPQIVIGRVESARLCLTTIYLSSDDDHADYDHDDDHHHAIMMTLNTGNDNL